MNLYDAIVELLMSQGAFRDTANELASRVLSKWNRRIGRDASDKRCMDMFCTKDADGDTIDYRSVATRLQCATSTTYKKLHRARKHSTKTHAA